jgi:hypothetical protein
VKRLSLAGRKEGARLAFTVFWLAGIVLVWVLPDHDGFGIRLGLGIPITVAGVYTGLRWAVLARQLRNAPADAVQVRAISSS